MRIGIFSSQFAAGTQSFENAVAEVKDVAAQGFATWWMPQIFGTDAITALSVIGSQVSGIELGTAVVPTYPRHPMMLASQALTAQAATGNRLALGIGLSHQIVIENLFGYSFAKPVGHMHDYLSILGPLLRGESVSHRGEHLSAAATIKAPPGATPPPVLVAALGPQMLRLCGRLADGTITWMTGPATLADHTVPTMTQASVEAGRPAPRIVCGLPVCVTDDPGAARVRAGVAFGFYDTLPSYKAMLDREGVSGPADVAIVGDAKTVTAAINRLRDAGATDFAAAEFAGSDDERKATRDALASLL